MRIAVLANFGLATTKVYGALADRGHDIHLFTFYEPAHEKTRSPKRLEALHPVFLPRQVKWVPPALALILRRKLVELRPDVWHAHIAIPYGITAALARWRPFILSTHGSDVYYRAWISKSGRLSLALPGRLSRVAFRTIHILLGALVDSVVVYSPDMMELLPRLGYPSEKLIPCFLGIDTALFRPIPKKPRPEAEFRIVCTRVLEPLYDHRTLLDSAAYLHREGFPVRLSLAGDGSARASLERYATQLGVRESVDFLGFVPHDELPHLLGVSDVLVSTARSDTTSMSVLEGMACGLPVVVTNVGSLARRIQNGVNGFTFDPGDAATLAFHLGRLARDEPLRKRMGEENRERAVREFDLHQTVLRLEEIYARAVEASPSRW